MKFTVIVNAHPASLTAHSALRFCRAVLANGHALYQVFFYGDGVFNGMAGEQTALYREWTQLIKENQIDVICCAGSAERKGLRSGADLADGFTISGLGQMIDALVHSDRVMTFGKRAALT